MKRLIFAQARIILCVLILLFIVPLCVAEESQMSEEYDATSNSLFFYNEIPFGTSIDTCQQLLEETGQEYTAVSEGTGQILRFTTVECFGLSMQKVELYFQDGALDAVHAFYSNYWSPPDGNNDLNHAFEDFVTVTRAVERVLGSATDGKIKRFKHGISEYFDYPLRDGKRNDDAIWNIYSQNDTCDLFVVESYSNVDVVLMRAPSSDLDNPKNSYCVDIFYLSHPESSDVHQGAPFQGSDGDYFSFSTQ